MDSIKVFQDKTFLYLTSILLSKRMELQTKIIKIAEAGVSLVFFISEFLYGLTLSSSRQIKPIVFEDEAHVFHHMSFLWIPAFVSWTEILESTKSPTELLLVSMHSKLLAMSDSAKAIVVT